MRLEQRLWILRGYLVVTRSCCESDCVAVTGGRVAPTVDDDECQRSSFIIQLGVSPFHPSFGLTNFIETKTTIQRMRVASSQEPATKALQLRMRSDHLNEPNTEPMPAVFNDYA